MPQTTAISTKELKRQAALVFEGKTIKVMLCLVTDTVYTAESTIVNWKTVEVSGNGYEEFSAIVPTGSYDSSIGAYSIPDVNAEFVCTTTYNYNRVVLYIDGEDYPHSVVTEAPNISLAAGQTQTYVIKLRQDD